MLDHRGDRKPCRSPRTTSGCGVASAPRGCSTGPRHPELPARSKEHVARDPPSVPQCRTRSGYEPKLTDDYSGVSHDGAATLQLIDHSPAQQLIDHGVTTLDINDGSAPGFQQKLVSTVPSGWATTEPGSPTVGRGSRSILVMSGRYRTSCAASRNHVGCAAAAIWKTTPWISVLRWRGARSTAHVRGRGREGRHRPGRGEWSPIASQ